MMLGCGSTRRCFCHLLLGQETVAPVTNAGFHQFTFQHQNMSLVNVTLPAGSAALKIGNVPLVTRLDRLTRSTRDLLHILAQFGDRRAAFRSLADAWADTTSPNGKLMITVVAEFERSLILARAPMAVPARREAKEPLTEIGRTYGVSHSTISRL